MTGNKLRGFALRRDIETVIRFENVRAFADRVQTSIEAQQRAFQAVVDSSVERGILTPQEAAEVQLKCTVDIRDERTVQNHPLPDVGGRWCVAPSAADLTSDPVK